MHSIVFSGEGNGTPLQSSCLENPMDGGAWKAAVHGVMKSQTWLSDFTFTFHFHALEKEMATHSSVLAWRIPGMGEPGGLPSMGSHRVGHNWSDLAAVAARGNKFQRNTYHANSPATQEHSPELQYTGCPKSHQTHWPFKTLCWTLHCTPERRNPAPPTRTQTQASLTRKPWQATNLLKNKAI